MPPEVIEIIRTGGPFSATLILAWVVVALYRENARIHAECAAELKEVNKTHAAELHAVQMARVEEMRTVATAAHALASTAEKWERIMEQQPPRRPR